MSNGTLGRAFLVAALMLGAGEPATGTQHLVAPGHDWVSVASRVRPGDQIILMPGRHRPGTLKGLEGTWAKPIIIGGLSPDNPAIIVAERYGIRLRRPRHVILQNLRITGATTHGIVIDDEGSPDRGGEPWTAEVTLRDVTVTKTGPRSKRSAIMLRGVKTVRLSNCHVEEWGGSAIDIVGCQNITINNSTFKGSAGLSESNAIMVRGGSDRIRIINCRIENPGERGLSLGSVSGLRRFRPSIEENAKPGSRFEATHVRVDHCVFIGGDCAVAIVNASDCRVRHSTFVRPRRWVLGALSEPHDPRIGPAQRITFGANIIVWQPGDLERLVQVDDGVDPEGIVIEPNLWWSPRMQDEWEKLGPLPGEQILAQVTNIDPDLDERHQPRTMQAKPFGAAGR